MPMLLRLLSVAGLSVLVACVQPKAAAARSKVTPSQFEPGQVWTLSGSKEDRDARIIVLAVGEHPSVGNIVHVRIEKLRKDWLPSSSCAEPRTVTHLAFAERTLQESVGQRVGERKLDESDTWELESELFEAAIVAPVAETLDAIYGHMKEVYRAAEEQPLPDLLPRDPGHGKKNDKDVSKIVIKMSCDAPAVDSSEKRKVHYELLGQRIADLASLTKTVSLLAASPRGDKPWRFIVEPQNRVTYADVASVVDTLLKAGFKDIHFGGRLGSKKQ